MMRATASKPPQQILTIRMIKTKVIMIIIKNTTSKPMPASIRITSNINKHMEVGVTTMNRVLSITLFELILNLLSKGAITMQMPTIHISKKVATMMASSRLIRTNIIMTNIMTKVHLPLVSKLNMVRQAIGAFVQY